MKLLKILIFFIFYYSSSIDSVNSQPTVDWRNYSWNPNDYNSQGYVDQRHSDYDWWYDHCTGYLNPNTQSNHIGYVACGVSKYRANSVQPIAWDERIPSVGGQYIGGCAFFEQPLFASACNKYDYENFGNPVSGHLGLSFNTIGRIKPDGTLAYLITMNNGGEYFRTKQLQDGSFLTVGQSQVTRKRNMDPMYYNPNGNNLTNLFNYDEIFTNGLCHRNSTHWDIMKFDGLNGTCLFNFIYGIYDFNSSPSTISYAQTPSSCCPNNVNINSKQLSYLSQGAAFDFIQEPNTTGNIAVVGSQGKAKSQMAGKASIIKIDNNGKILAKQFLDNTAGVKGSIARAVEFATINGTDYYICAITRSNVVGNGSSEVDIIRIPTSLGIKSPTVIETFSTLPNRQCTVWSMKRKGNKLYILLITNSNNVWWGGNNVGELYLKVIDLDLPIANPSSSPVINSVKLKDVHAYDLKARITELSNGNFGIVSTVKNQDWSTICSPSNIPPYILGANCPNASAGTGFWNTDTYVAEINPNGTIVWENTYDVDGPINCTDFPTAIDRGGNPKRQECMYGISEAPDKGLVVSGNSSDNLDDNYMIKLNPCTTPSVCQCDVPATTNVNIGAFNVSMTNGQVINTNLNSTNINLNYGGQCINVGCCYQNTNNITWTVFRRRANGGTESIISTGNTQAISFSAIFKSFIFKYQYRIEINHECSGNNCGTTNLIIRRS